MNQIKLYYEQALNSFQHDLIRARAMGDRLMEFNLLNNIGAMHNYLGQREQALNYLLQALNMIGVVGDRAIESSVLNNIGTVYSDSGQYAQGLQYLLRSLPLLRAEGSRDREGATLRNIGEAYRHLKQFDQALNYYQQALVMLKTVSDWARIGMTFKNIGEVYGELGQNELAIQAYQQALSVLRRAGHPTEELATLKNIWIIYFKLEQYDHAIQSLQQILMFARSIGDRADEADTLLWLGATHRYVKQYDQATIFFQQAVDLQRDLGDRTQEQIALKNLGEIYEHLEQFSQALKYYQQALTVTRQLGDRSGEGKFLGTMGGIYYQQGEYGQALAAFQQALGIAQALGDRREAAASLGNAGETYRNLGRYAQALEQFQLALHLVQDLGDRQSEAALLNNIGAAYLSIGQYQQVLEQFEQALNIAREIGERAGEASALNNIGETYRNLVNPVEALNYFEQSLVILREMNNRAKEGVTLSNIGLIYQSLSDPQALKHLEQALTIAREIGNRAGEVLALNNLAITYQSIGLYPQALRYSQQALEMAREIGAKTQEGYILSNIGDILLQLKQFKAAETALYEALSVLEGLRAFELSDADKVALFETQLQTYQALQLALVAQTKTDTALEVAERGRARAFVELLFKRLSTQALQPDASPSPISINSPSIAQIKQIAKTQNATLIEYSIVFYQLYIWVIHPTGEIAFRQVALDPSHPAITDIPLRENPLFRGATQSPILSELIDQTFSTFDRTSRKFISADAAATAEVPEDSLRQLYCLLIKPIVDLLPNDTLDRIIFIPHQGLFVVPFAALQDETGAYLIENYTLLMAPSIQVLAQTDQLRQASKNQIRGDGAIHPAEVLIVGNPTMPLQPVPPPLRPQQMPPLPGSQQEAEAIAHLLNASVYTGDQATKSTIVQQMPNARLIHLATHGLLEYGDPKASGIRDIPGALALAPDPAAATAEKINGLLTAAEIAELSLQAELVVLSACDTGRGHITGDGVIGLSRSFMIAGVPSIVVSLWQVSDQATAYLMMQFYQNLQHTHDQAQALRQAMLHSMQEYPDPHSWAAFTLIGQAL